MKTLNIFRTAMIAVMFVSVTGLSSYAKKPSSATATSIQNLIKENVKYTETVVEKGYSGVVDVLFILDDDGKIIIKKTSAENAEIEKMVKEQISALVLKDATTKFNKHYSIRITFQLSE